MSADSTSQSSKGRVLVIDAQVVARVAAKAMIAESDTLEHVGEARNGQEALPLIAKTDPSIVLMGIDGATPDAVESVKLVREKFPNLPILAWSTTAESDDLLSMVKAGCSGYVLKDFTGSELQRAIQAALRGEPVYPRKMLPSVLQRAAQQQPPKQRIDGLKLTDREMQILRLVSAGLSAKSIAKQLDVATSTVDTHTRSLYRKMGVSSRAEAVIMALRSGLVELADI